MSTPANPLAEFGATPVEAAPSNNTDAAQSTAPQTNNPLAEFGAVPVPSDEKSKSSAPQMVTQGHDRFGNVVRIPAKDTPGSLVGPLAIPVAAATIGAAPEIAGAAVGYAPEIAQAVVKHISEPGTILKFPFGRAVEYYMMGKLGLSKGAIGKIASHIPE
jgi:hypothetical protein